MPDSSPAWPQQPIRSELVGDADLAEILPLFVADLPQQVNRLLELLRERNVQELRRAMHQLKGCGGSYGFQCITDFAAAAERQILADAGLDAVAEGVQRLVELIRRVEGYDAGHESRASQQSAAP